VIEADEVDRYPVRWGCGEPEYLLRTSYVSGKVELEGHGSNLGRRVLLDIPNLRVVPVHQSNLIAILECGRVVLVDQNSRSLVHDFVAQGRVLRMLGLHTRICIFKSSGRTRHCIVIRDSGIPRRYRIELSLVQDLQCSPLKVQHILARALTSYEVPQRINGQASPQYVSDRRYPRVVSPSH
jgi:hypothetical protein